ncbi:MAG: type II secretion system F family protein [Ilumatobacteraceae bacterium]
MLAALLGAVGGTGLLLIVRGLRPRPVPLELLIARRRSAAISQPTGRPHPLARRVRIPQRSLAVLRVLERPVARHAVDKLLLAVVCAVLGLAASWFVAIIGSAPLASVLLVPAATVVGFTVPDLLVRSQADARRRQFRFTFGSYLDLVNVLLAGGAGVETALEAAAEIGDGWAYDELRRALLRSRTLRRSPWVTLGELGEELGVDELSDLAGSLQLAGEHGARIRSSLAAKASAARARQLAQIEADANSASERMGFPTVAMFVAFLGLLAYPAVQQIAGS